MFTVNNVARMSAFLIREQICLRLSSPDEKSTHPGYIPHNDVTLSEMVFSRMSARGTIIIELMLALAISFSILLLLFQLSLTTQKSYHAQAALTQLQYNANNAIDILRASIHDAGYIGCPRLTPEFPLHSISRHPFNAQNKIQAASNGPLLVRHAATSHVALLEPMRTRSLLQTDQRVEFEKNEIVIISDCAHAEIFQIKNIYRARDKQSILSSTNLHYRYGQNSEVAHWVQDEFQVVRSRNKNPNKLVVNDINRETDIIADGVDAMHIDVTINQEGVLREVPADAVKDWSKAIGLAITLKLIEPPYTKNWYFYASLRSS